jgi:hypothetical protein
MKVATLIAIFGVIVWAVTSLAFTFDMVRDVDSSALRFYNCLQILSLSIGFLTFFFVLLSKQK